VIFSLAWQRNQQLIPWHHPLLAILYITWHKTTLLSLSLLLLLLLLQNLPVTIAESNAGLVPPAVAQELMGAGEMHFVILVSVLCYVTSCDTTSISKSGVVSKWLTAGLVPTAVGTGALGCGKEELVSSPSRAAACSCGAESILSC
jgi:hypothetical protein